MSRRKAPPAPFDLLPEASLLTAALPAANSLLRALRRNPRLLVTVPVGLAAAVGLGAGTVAAQRWWMGPFRSNLPQPPVLVGYRHLFYTPTGPVPVRIREGRPGSQVIVFIHGWGGSADSSWWRLLPVLDALDQARDFTLVALDLPGHGLSPDLDKPFSLDMAAASVASALQAIGDHLGVDEVSLVGLSMGGPVSLLASRLLSSGHAPSDTAPSGTDSPGTDSSEPASRVSVSKMILLATTTHWDPLSLKARTFVGPWVLDDHSPVNSLLRRGRLASYPNLASAIAWGFLLRPSRRILLEATRSLRRFDARTWEKGAVPPITWIVTASDRIVPPALQRLAAAQLASSTVEIASSHSVAFLDPEPLAELIYQAATSAP